MENAARPEQLRRLLQGYRLSQALHVAAALGVADHLASGPRGVDELAALTGAHAESLRRLLRLLASEGVFVETEPRTFALTPMAGFLRTDAAGSVRHEAMFHGSELIWGAWGNLMHSVRTGGPAFEERFGKPFFEALSGRPAEAELFDRLMGEETRLTVEAILAAYDFSGLRTIVDVGGGRGTLLSAILKANPGARGILFDQPAVVAQAAPLLAAAGVADRCATSGGDFFASVPPGGDAYLLKYILHDWDDERCAAILAGCHRAMAPGARLLIVEMPLAPGNEPSYAKFIDLNMLVLLGGRERTVAEYQALLGGAGFTLTRTVPTASDFAILEATR